MGDATQILANIQSGDPSASEELLPLLYNELRRLAAAKLAQELPGQTLQPTALVHEAYLRLVSGNKGLNWDSRGHFFAAAAQAMRRILVERARQKQRKKHGGKFVRRPMAEFASEPPSDEIVHLDEALSVLAQEDDLAAKVVELRYFAGLTHSDVARALGITVYQARQKWTYARAWLRDALDAGA